MSRPIPTPIAATPKSVAASHATGGVPELDLGAVVHALRSPLSGVRMVLQSLSANDLSESARLGLAAEAIASIDSLDRRFQNLLHRGSEPMCSVDLGAASKEATNAFDVLARCRGGEIHCRIQPVWVRGAAEQLTIAAANLVDNAIVHGAEPPVVEVAVFAHQGWAVLQVANGPRADDVLACGSERVGTGLPAVRAIAQAHRGTLELVSDSQDRIVAELWLPLVGEGG